MKEGIIVPEEKTKLVFKQVDHPWIKKPMDDDSLDESARYSPDKIRVG